MSNEKDPIIAGHLLSDELSVPQKALANYIAYFAKMSVVISQSEANIKIEKAKGMQMYLRRIKEAQDQGKHLSSEEIKQIEKEVRFVTASAKLGGATTILRELLAHACTGEDFNKLIDNARKDAIKIASYSTTLDGISSWKKTDGL